VAKHFKDATTVMSGCMKNGVYLSQPTTLGLLFTQYLCLFSLTIQYLLWCPFKTDLFITDLFITDLFITDLFITDLFITDLFITDLFIRDLFITDLFITDLFITDHDHYRPVRNRLRS